MHATNTTQTQKVNFLVCFDQNDIAFSDEWVTSGQMPSPNVTAEHCANTTGIDFKAVRACGNGTQAEELLLDALHYFAKTFPMYTTGTRFDVPHVYINNVEQDVNLPGSAWPYLKFLCSKGVGASVCSALSASASRDVTV